MITATTIFFLAIFAGIGFFLFIVAVYWFMRRKKR